MAVNARKEKSIRHPESRDRSRAAVVYPVAGSDPVLWRVRAERHPGEGSWFGGKVLWGHDQDSEAAAAALAEAWTERGELPPGIDP